MTIKQRILFVFTALCLLHSVGQEYDITPSGKEFSFTELLDSARILMNASQREEAIVVLDYALEYPDSVIPRAQLAKALYIRGMAELYSYGPGDKPTRDLLQGLAIYKELNDSTGIANSNLQLDVLKYDIRNFESAIFHLSSVVEFREAVPYLVGVSQYLLALCYSELGRYYEAEQMFEVAAKEIGDSNPALMLNLKTFKARMWINQGESEEAIPVLESLLEGIETESDLENFAPTLAFLSTAYLNTEQYPSAINYGRKAYAASLGNGSAIMYLREALETLHQAYWTTNQHDSTYIST